MTIGQRIQNIRKEHKITQKQLSEMIGKGFSTVQKYEIDAIQPPWQIIEKIATVFGMTTAELMAGVEVWSGLHIESEYPIIEALKADTIAKYDRLNDLGKEKANEYITDLSENPKYTQQ
jgi:transcriptional regulator with XRE-family HTH domain